uniref:Elongation factor P-like n=1 Tax=Rhizophora mucronata TaxID=61149 RepID=A0A2P2LKG5_RHIMU
MRALKLLQLSNRFSRDLYSIAPSSSFSLHKVRTLAIPSFSSSSNFRSSPGHHSTFSDNLYGSPWSAVQRRGAKVNAIHVKPGNVIEKSGNFSYYYQSISIFIYFSHLYYLLSVVRGRRNAFVACFFCIWCPGRIYQVFSF